MLMSNDMLRMRQICLVARDLDAAQADLTAIFGLEVCYRDPNIGRLGLRNFLLPVGDSFLEVVAPMREGTTAERYLDRRGGDGGYTPGAKITAVHTNSVLYKDGLPSPVL